MALLSELAAGLPYGWRIVWAVKIEGIANLLAETVPEGAVSPSGYAMAGCLVVGADSAAVGSEVDRRSGVGRGYDLVVRLRDTDDARALVTEPAYSALMTADMGHADTSLSVASTAGWPSSGTLAVGTETMTYSGATATSFTGLTRGILGRAQDHDAGTGIATRVDSAPRIMVGRRVWLYGVPVDPYGRHHGADLLADAAEVWAGSIVDPPEADGLTWVIRCEPHDRALTRPALKTSGGSLVLSADVPWPISDPTVALYVSADGGTTLVTLQPFSGWAPGSAHNAAAYRSTLADALLSALTAAGAAISDVAWRHDADGWQMWAQTSDPAAAPAVLIAVEGFHPGPVTSDIMIPPNWAEPTSAGDWFAVALWTPDHAAWSGALAVRLDDAAPAELASTGWVRLEGGGMDGVYAYTAATPSDADPEVVGLLLDPSHTPPADAVAALAAADDAPDVTASIIYGDSGTVADLLRRLLVSSGRGTGGTYDTLPAGYDLPIDDDGIAATCAGLLGTLQLDLATADDGGLAGLFGGLIALARRAVVSRPHADGSGVSMTAVHVGGSSTAPPVATIDAGALVGRRGADPVRPRTAWATPAKIAVSLSRAGEDAGTVSIVDVDRQRTGAAGPWEVKVSGLRREELGGPAALWGQLLMVGEASAAVADVDVAPTVAAEVGDVVQVNVQHYALWQRSTGTRGYSGPARVLGAKTDLVSGVRTLTLLLDAGSAPVAWAPSARVTGWVGSASAPTVVDVPREYQPAIQAMIDDAGGPVPLWAYEPGADTAGAGVVHVSAAAYAGSVCALTVSSSSGSFILTTSWCLAVPDLMTGTDTQDAYAHDGVGRWT